MENEYNEEPQYPQMENEYNEESRPVMNDYTEHQINAEKPVEYISSQVDYQPYKQPYTNEYTQEEYVDNNPTVNTNRDIYKENDNISVSSIPYAKTQRTISDRDVTEQLNKIEFGKK